ncbi:MAG: autotransporter-associated beta strand repeat-containing protein [Verrucomicrobiaceae bacterium]|nr:autotransporter-associated beta strand repeat-containing protein [Verrucomicrobiaceae bacterium]
MTTLKPFARMKRSVAAISLACLMSSQVYLTAADFYLIRRGDGLNSIFSFAEKATPTIDDTVLISGLVDSALTFNSNTTANSTLSIGGIKMLPSATGAVTINPNASGASNQTLTLGAAGIDLSAAGANLTINKSNSQTLAIQLASSQSWLVGPSRTLTVNPNITGAVPLTVQTAGNGVANLNGSINLTGGQLILNNGSTGATTIGASGTSETVTAGTIVVNAMNTGATTFNSGVSAGNINVNSTSSGAINFNGIISGATTNLNIVNRSTALTTLVANNTFGGATSVTGGTLRLTYTGAGQNTSKLSDTSKLSLSRAVLNLTMPATGSHDEIINGLEVAAGFSQVTRTGSSGKLLAGALSRTLAGGGVVDFPTVDIVTTSTVNTNGILGGWATASSGTTTNWAISNAGNITTLVLPAANNAANTWTNPSDNINITAALSGNTGNATVNSLRFSTAAQTMTQTAGTTFTVASGGIMAVGNFARAIQPVSGTAFLTAGSSVAVTNSALRAGASINELFFHIDQNTMTVNSTIVDNSALSLVSLSPVVGLVKTRAGTLVLASNNTYTGGTVIAGGTLQVGAGAVGVGSAIGSLGSGPIQNFGELLFRRNNAITVSGISGTGNLKMDVGTQQLTLIGTNDYTGTTTIERGVLIAGADNVLPPFSAFSMGTDASAKLDVNTRNVEIGSLATGASSGEAGWVSIAGGTLTTGGLNTNTTFSNKIKGTGTLIKKGTGIFTLTALGLGEFNGAVQVTGGELIAPGNNTQLTTVTIGDGAKLTMAGNNTFSGPFTINGTGVFAPGAAATNTFNGSFNYNSTATHTFASGSTTNLSAVNVSSGNLVFAGAVNGFTSLNISGGTVTVNRVGGVIGNTAPVNLSAPGAILAINQNETIGDLTGIFGSQVSVATGMALTFGTASNATFEGAMTGAGSYTKNGAGDLTIGGGNGFTGTLNVNSGRILLGVDTPLFVRPDMLPDAGRVVLASGTELVMNDRSEAVGLLEGAGNITLGDGSIAFGGLGGTNVLSGVISGSSNSVVTKNGLGTTTLSGASTFTGTLVINGGTLALANAAGNALSDTVAVNLKQAGSVLSVSGLGETIGDLRGAEGSVISLDGRLTMSNVQGTGSEGEGSGTAGSPVWLGSTPNAALPFSVGMKVINSDVVTGSSWVTQVSGSDKLLFSRGLIDGSGGTTFIPTSVLKSNTNGASGLTKNGNGVLIFLGNQAHTGDTVINGGEVVLGGFESGGRFVNQNVFSDNSQLVLGSTGNQVINFASSGSNLYTFERIGSLSGGNGNSSVVNLMENSHLVNLATQVESANVGTLVMGGDNRSSVFHGIIDGKDVDFRAWVIKEGTGRFEYQADRSSGFQGVARVENGTFAVSTGEGLAFDGTRASSINVSNKSLAVFETSISEIVDLLAGGAGVRSATRTGIPGALMGNYLGEQGGELKLLGANSGIVIRGSSSDYSFAGAITGDGSITKLGSRTFQIVGSNTASGVLSVNAGAVELGYLSRAEGVGSLVSNARRGNLAPLSSITLGASGRLALNGFDSEIQSLSGVSSATVELGGGSFTLLNSNGSFASAVVSGGGRSGTGDGLQHVGRLRIVGGATTIPDSNSEINGPAVDLENASLVLNKGLSAFADFTRLTVGTGGVLSFGVDNSIGETIGSISGSGTVNLGTLAAPGRSLTLTQGGGYQHGAFTGSIVGTGSLVLLGGGLVVSGANSYSGGTTIGLGTELVIANGLGSLADVSSVIPDVGGFLLNGGVIRVGGDRLENLGTVTLGAGANAIRRNLLVGGAVDIGSPTRSLGAALIAGFGAVQTSLSNSPTTGILGGYAVHDGSKWAAVALGGGTQTIAEYTGTYVGTLGSDKHVDATLLSSSVILNPTVGTLNFAGASANKTLTVDGLFTISTGGILITRDSSTQSLTLTGTTSPANVGNPPRFQSSVDEIFIHQFNEDAPMFLNLRAQDASVTPSSFAKTGPGTLVITSDNEQSGAFVIGGGEVQIGNGGFTGALRSPSAVLDIVNTGILTFYRDGFYDVSGPIKGTGAVRSIGEGTITLATSGSEYTGRTSVQAGTLVAQTVSSLGSPLGGTSVEAGALLVSLGGLAEPVALKGGSLEVDTGSMTYPLTIFGGGTLIQATSSLVFDAPVFDPFFPPIPTVLLPNPISTVFKGGANSSIELRDLTSLGSFQLQGGKLVLANGSFVPSSSKVDMTSSNSTLVLATTAFHNVFANDILGVGGLLIQAPPSSNRQYWLLGNNTYSGTTRVGALSGESPSVRATLHIGADSFSGSIGSSNLIVTAAEDERTFVRTHLYNTLTISGDITLNPVRDSANGRTGRNAELIKEGMGDLRISGTVTSGALGANMLGDGKFLNNESLPENPNTNPYISGPERALITSQSGRLIFDNATIDSSTNSWVGDNSGPGPLAIANNSYVEFRANSAGHEYEIFGALTGGGTWIFNSPGTVKLSNELEYFDFDDDINTPDTNYRPVSTWSGNAMVQRGTLATSVSNQMLSTRLFLNAGSELAVVGRQSLPTLAAVSGSSISLDGTGQLLTSGGINNATVSGGGDLTFDGGTTEVYVGDSSYSGASVIMNGAVVRVTHLADSGSSSSLGAGTSVFFGTDVSTGTLDYVGKDNVSTDRTIITVTSDDLLLSPYLTPASTLAANGFGTLTWTGDIFQSFFDEAGGSRWFALGGESRDVNVFSGIISYIDSEIGLRKSGGGNWRLSGSRPSYAGDVQLSGGTLEISQFSALGNLAVARDIYLSGGSLVRFDSGVAGNNVLPITTSVISTGGNSGIINNDLDATLTIAGSITQDISQAAIDNGTYQSGRTLTFGGSSTSGVNIVSGAVTGAQMGLNKSGDSHWRFTGPLTLGLGTTISAGILEINGTGGLADTGTVTLNTSEATKVGGYFSQLIYGVSDTIGALAGNLGSKVTLGPGGSTLTMQSASSTYAGIIEGDGGVKLTTNANAGRDLTLPNKNTYTGPTSIVNDVGSNVGATRIRAYYLANGGVASSIGASPSAAANLLISTKTGSGGLEFLGFNSQSTDRLFTVGAGSGSSGEASAAFWASGQNYGSNPATIRFTNPGAIAYEGSGARRIQLRGGNLGTVAATLNLGTGQFSYVTHFNEMAPAIADGPGGATSIRKLEASNWLLSGNNLFTGAVTIERGTLSISHNSALGSSAGGVVVTQASDDIRSFLDLRGVTVTGEQLTLSGGANGNAFGWGASSGTNVWSGNVANNAGARWAVINNPATPGITTSLRLSGNLTGSGSITHVGNGVLVLAGDNSGYSGAFTAGGGVLQLDYTSSNTTKLPNGVALTLGGTSNVGVQGVRTRGQDNADFQSGTIIRLTGGSHTEVVNGLTLNRGASYVERTSGTSTLQVSAITRGQNNGATLDVMSGSVTTTTLNRNGIVGGYLTVGKTDWGVTVDTTPASPASPHVPILPFSGYVASAGAVSGATSHWDVQGDGTLAGGAIVGSLRFNTGAPITVTMSGAVTIDSGGILVTAGVGSSDVQISGGSITAAGTAPAIRDIVVHQFNTARPFTIGSLITGSNVSLTKSGAGELVLLEVNDYTSGTYVNEGTLRLGNNFDGLGTNAKLGTGGLTVNGKLIVDLGLGADYAMPALNGGDGVIELAETNQRTISFSGDNGGFQGVINVYGGTLKGFGNASNSNALGNGRTLINVGPLGGLDITNTTGTITSMGSDIHLQGRLLSSGTTGVATGQISGSLFILDSGAEINIGNPSVTNGATFPQLNLNGAVFSTVGLRKTGKGTLSLGAAQFADAIVGTIGRNLAPSLSGEILVEEGRLFLSGGGRAAGATGIDNRIIVSDGATVDLRDADLNYGDDPDTERKVIEIVGAGMGGNGSLLNTSGTGTAVKVLVAGDATIGTGGLLNGSALEFAPYDTTVETGATLEGVTDFVAPSLEKSGFAPAIVTKVGTGDLVFRDTLFDSFSGLNISEGRVRFERSTLPPAGQPSGLAVSDFQTINLEFGAPSKLDVNNANSTTGPIFGPRLEFFRQNGMRHEVPIFLNGSVSESKGAANYLQLNANSTGIPGPATTIGGQIEVSGSAFSNIFDIESGVGGGSLGATIQGNMVSEVQGKLMIAGEIVGAGGFSKVGSRELRFTSSAVHTGHTYLTRQGTINVPSRSDAVTVNGITYQNQGEAESWAEFGTTLMGPQGALLSTTEIRLERNALLTLDNTDRLGATSGVSGANNNNRINDAAIIKLLNGTLRVMGGDVANTESIASSGAGSLIVQGGSNFIDLWNTDGADVNLTLTIGKLSRSAGSVLRFRAFDSTASFSTASVGDSVRVKLNTAPDLASGIEQVGGASGMSKSVITGLLGGTAPHAIYKDTRLSSDLYAQGRNLQNATGSHFMTYDSVAGYIRPLDDSEYFVPTSGLVESSNANGFNVSLVDPVQYTRTSTSVNSLRFGPVSNHNLTTNAAINDRTNLTSYNGNWVSTLYLDDTATLSIASGMLASAAFGVGPSMNLTTLIRGGTLDFGTREAIISNQNYWLRMTDGVYGSNNFEIQSRIAGSGGLTKVGAPSVVLDAQSTYSGKTYVNEGILYVRSGRNGLGVGGSNNGIMVQGLGDFRMTNGVIVGSAVAPENLEVGILVNDGQQILRSDNGNNYLYGDIIYDNVDSVRHANPAARPRISVAGNQSLQIIGDVYGGNSLVTEDATYTDSRLITFEGNGFIRIRGQVGDKGLNGNAIPVGQAVVGGRTVTNTSINENQVFRLHMASNQDMNLTLDSQYNAAGRLALDQGTLLINYDPTAVGNDGTGFWTKDAISRIALAPTGTAAGDVPLFGNSNSVNFITNASGTVVNSGNGGTSMHGFSMGGLNIGAGNQAVFMTRSGQQFNMGTWTVSGNGGTALLGGLNDTGSVKYGTGRGTLTLGRTTRLYATSGGTVEFDYRFNGGTVQKVGLGTVVINNSTTINDSTLAPGSDTHNVDIAGGRLVIDHSNSDRTIALARLGNSGNFTANGGTFVARGFDPAVTTVTDRTLSLSTNTGTRTIAFQSGNTSMVAEARGVHGMLLTMGNGGDSTALTRAEGATGAFAAYNSTGGAGVGEIRINFNGGIAHADPKNHVMPWAVSGNAPRTAVDFAMIDSAASNRVRTFNRALDEYKNDVSTWLTGEDVSENTLTSAGGSGFRGTLPSSLIVNTIRFDAPASSIFNVGNGQTLQVAQSGIMVSTNTANANKTITGGRLNSSKILGGRVTASSNLITNLDSTAGIYVGMPVSGTGIPIGAFVDAVMDGTTVRISTNATVTTALAAQGIVFGTRELIIHQYGQGNLVIDSGLGDGNSLLTGVGMTDGSITLSMSTTIGLLPGQGLVGAGIPAGAVVVQVTGPTTATMSLPATETLSNQTVELVPIRTGPATLAGVTKDGGQPKHIDVAFTSHVVPGMVVAGPGIPLGTSIVQVKSATSLELSNDVTSAVNGSAVYVTTPNDPLNTPVVTFTGGSTSLDQTLAKVSNTAAMKVGMGIIGTQIPADAIVTSIARDADSSNVTDFNISLAALGTSASQTFFGVTGVVPLAGASTTLGTSTVTLPLTAGLRIGMAVRLPNVPANATVATIGAGSFTFTPGTSSDNGSGLVGYAQHPGNMPSLLTGGVTNNSLAQQNRLVVHSTKGLLPGMTIAGPNLASGTVITLVVNGTDLNISPPVTGNGTNQTYVVGTQTALPASLLAGETVAGSPRVRVASTLGLQEGLILIGPGIPAAATIVTVDSSQQFTMSNNATVTASNVSIRAVSPMALTISGPSTTGPNEQGTTGVVTLTNPINNFGGKTYINGGVLSISHESALGIASAVGTNDQVTINGGTLRWTGLNGQLAPTRGLTLGGNGGVIDVAESNGHLFIQRSVFSVDQYRGDLIKTGPGQLIFEGDDAQQANFRGLLDIRQGTVRMAGDSPSAGAGTSTMFGSNISWADGTIVRSGANLMIQMGNANGGGEWNFEEFITFEGHNALTVGTPSGPRLTVNWNGPMRINGNLVIDTTLNQTFRLNTGGGYVEGSGDIIKEGMGILEFRENIPDWTGGLVVRQGRVNAMNQADALGTGHLFNKRITLGSNEHAGEAELFIQSDLGTAGSVWEVNMPIDITYNPAQTKRIGAQFQPVNGMDFRFNGPIVVGDNLVLSYIDNNNGTPVGGEIVHITYAGGFSDSVLTSGNLILQTREGAPNPNDSSNGRFTTYHRFAGDNLGWSGDLVISDNIYRETDTTSDNPNYNHDQTTVARADNPNAFSSLNEVVMNFNSVFQIGGNSITIGGLQTRGGDGPLATNVGTIVGSALATSSEIVENAASTVGTLTIHQTTPVQTEVKWDAMFRDGTLPSHYFSLGQGAAAAALNIVKSGEGWATLSLDNDYTGSTTLVEGVLQIGVGGIGDTGSPRDRATASFSSGADSIVAGTGVIQGAAVINGEVSPGDVAGRAVGTLYVNGNTTLGASSVARMQIRCAAINVPSISRMFLDASGNVAGAPFYKARRDLAIGTPLSGEATFAKDLSDPVYSNHHDQLRGSGTLTVQSGAVTIVELDGYNPIGGDVFRLFQFESYGGSQPSEPQFVPGGTTVAGVNLPALPSSFRWDVSMFASHGLLIVVEVSATGGVVSDEYIGMIQYPQHQIVPIGSAASFTTRAAGPFSSAKLSHKWFKGTKFVDAAVVHDETVDNEVATSYSTPPLTTTSVSKYVFQINNDADATGSLRRFPATEAACVDMTGTEVFLADNGTTTFVMKAYGSSSSIFRYKWFKDGSPISDGPKYSGTTKSALVIKGFTTGEVGNYRCRVSIPALFTGTGALQVAEGSTFGPIHRVARLDTKPEFVTTTGSQADDLAPIPPGGKVSAPYSFTVAVKSGDFRKPTKFSATGLPAGLAIDNAGVISGTPTTAKTYSNIRITATNAKGSQASKAFSMVIAPIAGNAQGTLVALADRQTTMLPRGARIDLTIKSTGDYTAKLTDGTTATSGKGKINNGTNPPSVTILFKRKAPLAPLTLQADFLSTSADGHYFKGTLTDGTLTTGVDGWRNIWSTKKGAVKEALSRYGSHNVQATFANSGNEGDLGIPQGITTGIIKVTRPGVAGASLRMGDGTAASSSAPLGPEGQVLIYKAIYSSKQQGTVHGIASVAEDIDHIVTDAPDTLGAGIEWADLSWSKPAPPVGGTVGKLYHNGWTNPIQLTVNGGLYRAPLARKLPAVPVGEIVMELPGTPGNAEMVFDYGEPTVGNPEYGNLGSARATELNLPFTIASTAKVTIPAFNASLPVNPNPGKLKITSFNSTTGQFSGTASIVDGGATRSLTFSGLVVPNTSTVSGSVAAPSKDGLGVGYFILQDLPTSPVVQKAGAVTLQPVGP